MKDYSILYRLQDKFLLFWADTGFPFYLTGGTALGRFYLGHRFSEDLDFFLNDDKNYHKYVDGILKAASAKFKINREQLLFSDDFVRFFIEEEDAYLKIELVNDVTYRQAPPVIYRFGYIDTPVNILANKITAVVGRDEPKDVFDIVNIALNYSFNWRETFYHAKQKAVINEVDVVQRLASFPVEMFENVNWLASPPDPEQIKNEIQQIADDFLLGRLNSLGKDKPPIERGMPVNG